MSGLSSMSHNKNLDAQYTMGKNVEDIGSRYDNQNGYGEMLIDGMEFLNGEVGGMSIDWDYYKENPDMLPEDYKAEAQRKGINVGSSVVLNSKLHYENLDDQYAMDKNPKDIGSRYDNQNGYGEMLIDGMEFLNGEVGGMSIDWDYYKENPDMLPEDYKAEAQRRGINVGSSVVQNSKYNNISYSKKVKSIFKKNTSDGEKVFSVISNNVESSRKIIRKKILEDFINNAEKLIKKSVNSPLGREKDKYQILLDENSNEFEAFEHQYKANFVNFIDKNNRKNKDQINVLIKEKEKYYNDDIGKFSKFDGLDKKVFYFIKNKLRILYEIRDINFGKGPRLNFNDSSKWIEKAINKKNKLAKENELSNPFDDPKIKKIMNGGFLNLAKKDIN